MPYPQFPLKLYGREARLQKALESFSLVREQGTPQVLMFSGESGIGKSAIANQAQMEFLSHGACCISGKCDRFQQDVPYFAVRSAFSDLVRQIEERGVQQQHQWQEKLLAAIGNNGRVILDTIPDMERIIGPQPPMPEIESGMAQRRCNLVFQNFVRACCSRENPLTVFLDDLQWADYATLRLVELVMTDDECCLLLLGAYRSNEVDGNHPLAVTIEALESAGTHIQQLHLEPLSNCQVWQFVADTLQESTERTMSLAQLMFQQTAGNPLFLKRLFQYLCLQNQLGQIEHLPGQDLNELTAQNLTQLSVQERRLLWQAACMGKAPLRILAVLNENSISETLALLKSALEIQLIVLDREASEPTIQFPHDRIHQIVYDSIPLSTKTAIHLAAGKATVDEEDLFTGVNQLNLGSSLLTSQNEKDNLAKLNLKAAQQAKLTTAFESALTYICRALKLANDWELNYDLVLELRQEAIELESLNGNFEQSHTLADEALMYAARSDQIEIYQLKIQTCIAQSQFSDAIDLGVSVLEAFGIDPQADPPDISITALENLPEANDQIGITSLKILNAISGAALIVAPNRLPSMVFAEINLLARIGNSSLSALVYSDYAYLLCASGEIAEGFKYGDLALNKNKYPNKYKVLNALNCAVRFWKRPLVETLEALDDTIALALESGDPEFVGWAGLNFCNHSFFTGKELGKVKAEYRKYNDLFDELKLVFAIQANAIFTQVLENLTTTGNSQIANELLTGFRNAGIANCLLFAHTANGLLSYLLGDCRASASSLEEAERYLESGAGFYITVVHNFYQSLSLLSSYPSTPESDRPAILEKVDANQTQMRTWADHCPENFEHKYQLVEAEKARVLGQGAIAHYELAIHGARENGYIQEEALALERLGDYYTLSDIYQALACLEDARTSYNKWGAKAKVEKLDEKIERLQLTCNLLDRFVADCNLPPGSKIYRELKDGQIAIVIRTSNMKDGQAVWANMEAIAILAKSIHLASQCIIEVKHKGHIRRLPAKQIQYFISRGTMNTIGKTDIEVLRLFDGPKSCGGVDHATGKLVWASLAIVTTSGKEYADIIGSDINSELWTPHELEQLNKDLVQVGTLHDPVYWAYNWERDEHGLWRRVRHQFRAERIFLGHINGRVTRFSLGVEIVE